MPRAVRGGIQFRESRTHVQSSDRVQCSPGLRSFSCTYFRGARDLPVVLTYFVRCLCLSGNLYLLTSCVALSRAENAVVLHENVVFGCKNYVVNACPDRNLLTYLLQFRVP